MRDISYYIDPDLPFLEVKSSTNQAPEKKHAHEEYSLAFITNGQSTFTYAGKTIALKANQLVFIAAHIMHYCQPDEDSQWSYHMLYINRNWFDNMMPKNFQSAEVVVANVTASESSHICNLISELQKDVPIYNKSEVLIELLYRVFENDRRYTFENDQNISNVQLANRIKAYIEAHIDEKVALETLSEHFDVTPYYIIKLFKQILDTTPHAYIMSQKMNRAKVLMQENQDLTQICYQLGFYDQSHFTRTFKAYFTMTPRQYLKSIGL